MNTDTTQETSHLTKDDRGRIKRRLMSMPYAGGLRLTGWTSVFGNDVTVDRLVTFLDELSERLNTAANTARENERELDVLRRQREAVRAFLGTGEPE